MLYFKKIIRESLSSILITTSIVVFAGTSLSVFEDSLVLIPILLLLLPSLNNIVGNLLTVFISRLSVHFVLGAIPMKFSWNKQIKEDFIGLFTTMILSILLLMGASYVYAFSVGMTVLKPLSVIFIIFLSAIILFVSLFFGFYFMTNLIVKKNRDPNNVLIPYATSIVDLFFPIVIFLFVMLFI